MTKLFSKLIPTLCVAAIIILFCWGMGFQKYLHLPPDGFHSGAQTDRASLVYNYWQNNTTFLYPEVMENRNNSGIVGCEFPAIYFTLAQVFKFTGFSYEIYRLTVFLFYLIGLLSAYQIARFYIKSIPSVLITLLWASSPILCFYALNFLPDVPAMGLSMLGWRLVLKQRKNKAKLIIGLFVFAVAGLLKASYAIHLAVAVSIYIIENRQIQWKVLVAGLLSIGMVAGWYEWATYLNEKFQNPHFLLAANPAENFPDFINIIHENWKVWQPEFYRWTTLMLIGLGLFWLVSKKIEQRLLRIITIRLLLLGIVFYILFQKQFVYHDYYLIAFCPLVFFLILIAYIQLREWFLINWILRVLILLIALSNFNFTKKQLQARHSPGNYYYQPAMPGTIEKYWGIDSFLNKYVSKNTFIISAFDNNPNATLFFAKRKGVRIAKDFPDDLIEEIMTAPKYPFILSNDDEDLKERLLRIGFELKNPIDSFNGIKLYRNPFTKPN